MLTADNHPRILNIFGIGAVVVQKKIAIMLK